MTKLTGILMAKRLTQISMVLLMLACFTALSSCGDDDDKKKQPKNQVKVDGKTFNFTRGYIASQQLTNAEEEVVGSQHLVFLTGGDLEMEDGLIMSGEGHFLVMHILTDDHNDLVG